MLLIRNFVLSPLDHSSRLIDDCLSFRHGVFRTSKLIKDALDVDLSHLKCASNTISLLNFDLFLS